MDCGVVWETIFCRSLTLYLTRCRAYKFARPPQTKPRRGGDLRQINTCCKVPLLVNYTDIWHWFLSVEFFYGYRFKIGYRTGTRNGTLEEREGGWIVDDMFFIDQPDLPKGFFFTGFKNTWCIPVASRIIILFCVPQPVGNGICASLSPFTVSVLSLEKRSNLRCVTGCALAWINLSLQAVSTKSLPSKTWY